METAPGSDADYSSPVQIPGTTWSKIVTWENTYFATKTDGTMWAWGANSHGQLGQNNRTYYSSPVQVGSETTWNKIRGNGPFALKTDGTLWAWGQNGYGQLGQNDTNKRSSPVQIPGTTWNEIGQTGRDDLMNNYAIKTDGTLWTWGGNREGCAGTNENGDNVRRSSPTQIPGTDWHSIEQGGDGNIYLFKAV